MRPDGRRGAVLALVLLVSLLLWSLGIAVLVVASAQHAIAHASLDRASALAVAHHLVTERRSAWDAWLAGVGPPPEDEDGRVDTCRWHVTIEEATADHVRATVDVAFGRSEVRVGASAYPP